MQDDSYSWGWVKTTNQVTFIPGERPNSWRERESLKQLPFLFNIFKQYSTVVCVCVLTVSYSTVYVIFRVKVLVNVLVITKFIMAILINVVFFPR